MIISARAAAVAIAVVAAAVAVAAGVVTDVLIAASSSRLGRTLTVSSNSM